MNIGQWIRSQRKLRGLSLETLEKQSGISRSTISRIERDELSPTWDNVRLLISVMGLPIEAAIESGAVDWPRAEPLRSRAYEKLDRKLNYISSRICAIESEGYVWIEMPEGTYEVDPGDIEKLDAESDEFLRFKLTQLVSSKPERFRSKKR